MAQLQVWKEFFQESDEVNIVNIDGDFKFQASHLCKVLGYKSTQVALQTHCEDYEIVKLDIGQHYDVNFVTESGFYSLVLGSQKPKAKAFKKWVCRVVLPKLRASNSKPADIASLIDVQEMSDRFQFLLDLEQDKVKQLEASLTAKPLTQESEFLDLLVQPLESKFPYTLEDLWQASGIASKGYVSNVVKVAFEVDEDYHGYRFGDNKVTPKRLTTACYNILMVCFRSAKGVDLTAVPAIIAIERDRYYAARQPRSVNKLIQHPDQLSLF